MANTINKGEELKETKEIIKEEIDKEKLSKNITISKGLLIASTGLFRSAALASAYATINSDYETYRNRVIEKFGDKLREHHEENEKES